MGLWVTAPAGGVVHLTWGSVGGVTLDTEDTPDRKTNFKSVNDATQSDGTLGHGRGCPGQHSQAGDGDRNERLSVVYRCL